MNPDVHALVLAAQAAGGTVIQTPAATIIVIPTVRAADPDELLPVAEAAQLVGCSTRALREAQRRGDLVLRGRQRSRVVRRADLLAWIESQRSPSARVADGQAGRVERRLRALRGGRDAVDRAIALAGGRP